MNSCQEMVDYFYSYILHLLNLPTINNFDKPWVTPEFRNLVKQRQRASCRKNHFIVSRVIMYNAWQFHSVNSITVRN